MSFIEKMVKSDRSHSKGVIVIGAGLTGSCIALELANQGIKVALLDQDSVPMNRASRRNEGKIHLGLIYAADPSFSTADLQLRGALLFFHLLKRWIGDKVHDLQLSTPFIYLVAKDSVLIPDQLEKHYEKVASAYQEQIAANSNLSYLGTCPDFMARRVDLNKLDSRLDADSFVAAFETSELAIDTDQLSDIITQAINAADNISFYPKHKAREIEQKGDGFVVSGESHGSNWSLTSEQVVNASWESRLMLDSTLGLHPPSGWLYRLKYRVMAHLPKNLINAPSITMVLGRYGDVVIRTNGTAYLSWYPAGMRGWSNELEPPLEWGPVCAGDKRAQSPGIVDEIIEGIKRWYPEVGNCKPYQLDAGVIVAYGSTDVNDPESGLHDRTCIGVFSSGGYHSVDPGKLTTAPYFAIQAAESVASFFNCQTAVVSVEK
ncbi:MAG: FAD-binding oxidoreductase [Phycisphaeraceae bacterium]|nr:FAD-binding oxidoreductase [Phycisphaeraceae bacterium]